LRSVVLYFLLKTADCDYSVGLSVGMRDGHADEAQSTSYVRQQTSPSCRSFSASLTLLDASLRHQLTVRRSSGGFSTVTLTALKRNLLPSTFSACRNCRIASSFEHARSLTTNTGRSGVRIHPNSSNRNAAERTSRCRCVET